MFGKYVDKFNRMRIKYTRQMKFCINEYQLLNSKYDQYENRTLINDLDIDHYIGRGVVHEAHHILMLMMLYRYIISVS